MQKRRCCQRRSGAPNAWNRPTSTGADGSDPLWLCWRGKPSRDPRVSLRRIQVESIGSKLNFLASGCNQSQHRSHWAVALDSNFEESGLQGHLVGARLNHVRCPTFEAPQLMVSALKLTPGVEVAVFDV